MRILHDLTTPWSRDAIDAETRAYIEGMALEGRIAFSAKSPGGPFVVRLFVDGMQPIRASGATIRAAIVAAIAEIAA